MNLARQTLVNTLSCMLALTPIGAVAQTEDQGGASDWEHSVLIYLMAPTIDGTVGVGAANADVDVDPSTIFDNLDMGLMAAWTAEKGDWGMLLDFVYMDLSADFKIAGERIPGEFGNKQLITSFNGLYRVTDTMQLMGGLMYTDLTMKLALDGPVQPRRFKQGESWYDMVVGLRFATPISERWGFAGFGQIGGFGMGADLVWQLSGSFSFQMTERSELLLGYRYMSFDYENGTGPNRFKFDVAEHGPAAGFRFKF